MKEYPAALISLSSYWRNEMKIFALILFALMYVLMIAKPKYRPLYALSVAAIFLISGILPWKDLMSTINWNVLLMISGTMIIVYYFIESHMPNLLADILLEKAKNVMWVTILMSLFAGVISAFIDNVATVLMVAPVGMAICKKLNMSPVGMILSIAVSSNLQGAATLVGDTTSIMLGDYANMNFMDFFWMNGKPGIFFAVELATCKAIVSDRSLIRSSLKGKREILKEDILLIADISIGKGDRHYVVYPQSFGRAEVEKHFSVYLSMGERTALIQRDKRLLVFLKTKRFTELLTTFGYDSKITIIDY